MFDFTSSHYLGLAHASWEIGPWNQLTTGLPAALAPTPGSDAVARRLAALQGCERATLGTSTLHLFWDLFGMFPPRDFAVFLDREAYAVAEWGVERAHGRGVPVHRFAHYDPHALEAKLRQAGAAGRKPIVVADGFCPACGRSPPVREFWGLVQARHGYLVLDDTQALGILGAKATLAVPYGRGGGGSLKFTGVAGPEVILVSSLAKGFGAPLAALSGSSSLVNGFEERSQTRVHCSPPSVAAVRAAAHALEVNGRHGELLRRRLARIVRRFQVRLADTGLTTTGGKFPVQTLALSGSLDTTRLHQALLCGGVRTVLRRGEEWRAPRISFILTARHQPEEIDGAVEVLARAVRALPTERSTIGSKP